MSETTQDNHKTKLPDHWQQVHGAIWLIGIAILAWQGWWWPGILVLVAISSLAEAGLRFYVSRTEQEQAQQQERVHSLPATCPNCGSPLSADSVRWNESGDPLCPYCGSHVGSK